LPPNGKGVVADFSEFRKADRITGSVLDAGCGTGENALYFAGRGCQVTGIDFLEEPINRARRKAGERGLPTTFLVKNALTLKDWSERFDTVIDSGLFHVFTDEDRRRYVEGLATVLKPGGRLFLGCFSEEEPGTQGPRRVSKEELHAAFAEGWFIESIEPSRYEVRPDLVEARLAGAPPVFFLPPAGPGHPRRRPGVGLASCGKRAEGMGESVLTLTDPEYRNTIQGAD
jgi:SAM-dependent methyltransferase